VATFSSITRFGRSSKGQLSTATRVIVSHGLSAPTATIAQKAGISSGSLFTSFETKADLFNHLFLELKTEMTAVALKGFPATNDLREQVFHLWSNWMDWATSDPEKAARAGAAQCF
jgi:AcrR family transcriptional regulator